jgi:hypothetical protein
LRAVCGLTITFCIVSDGRLHLIADCLSDDWVEDWAREGIGEVETFLGKHAAFESFLGESDD